MKITVEHPNGKDKAQISDECLGLSLLVMINGMQWSAAPISPQTLELIKAVIAKYEEALKEATPHE